ncbi:hypothetical protein D9619_012558 [Psilocybe cf. subviscida]|uniref:F-box domain-containing protein n=1 Tax=Psilocybe cf. subviscida TaxID=2480587 RepID=A0A8H5B6P7_9AGAR|nr:hypothetical protein D9619_012558 [Psilocybe cf. subviscida]
MASQEILVPDDPRQEHDLARLDTLPTDIILQICKYLPGWRDMLDLLMVSPSLYRLHAEREIWSVLVSSCLNVSDAPRICYPDHPIYCYSADELRRTFIRWKVAENIWKDRAQVCKNDLGIYEPVLREVPVIRTTHTPFELQDRSILIPGGRWLIVLTDAVSAVYYDLTSTVDTHTPGLCTLFPSQLRPETQDDTGKQISVSLPDVDMASAHAPLKFRFAITFTSSTGTSENGASCCVLQIWEVTTVLDGDGDSQPQPQSSQSRLSATLLASISFPLLLSGEFISAKAITGNNVVVDIPNLRLGPTTTCIAMIDWTTIRHAEDGFKRRVIVFEGILHSAMLLGAHNLLLTSHKGIFLYDYRRTKVIRSFSGKGIDIPVDPDHSMLCRSFASGEFHFVSAPVIVRLPNGTTSQNVACCNSGGEMHLISISPRRSQLPHSDDREGPQSTGDLGKDQVESWYLGDSPARKAFKKTLASTTTMCLGVNQGVILDRTIRKYGGVNTQLSIACYEREALDRIAKSVNDESQDSAFGGGLYGDYVVGQVISRDIPIRFGGPSNHGHTTDSSSSSVLFFDESIARMVLYVDRRFHIVDL